MRKLLAMLFSLGFLSSFVFSAFDIDAKKKPEDVAKENVKKAIDFYKKAGNIEDLYSEINKIDGEFTSKDKEYYVYVFSTTGVTLSRGDGNLKLIGKERINDQDTNGKFYIKEILQKANKPGASGWVDYTRKNPKTNQVENKSSYNENIEAKHKDGKIENIILGCGYYKGK